MEAIAPLNAVNGPRTAPGSTVTRLCASSPRTKSAFDAKMQKASRSTDLRVPPSLCTMFNLLADAQKHCAKLCALDTGHEVTSDPVHLL